MQITDHLNRRLTLADPIKRIVSLVPSQSELIYDLGLDTELVGVTKFCVYPEHLKSTRIVVGGTKQLHYERVKDLKPDIILCNKEENTKEMVAELSNIAPVHVSNVNTFDDALLLIDDYGKIFNKELKAASIIENLKHQATAFSQFLKTQPVIKVAYFIWRKPWMVTASSTFIDALLTLNKFENVFASKYRYPEVNLSDSNFKNAAVLLLSSEPYPFSELHKKELHEIFPGTKILLVNGEYFSWYGTRLQQAFLYFKSLRQKIATT